MFNFMESVSEKYRVVSYIIIHYSMSLSISYFVVLFRNFHVLIVHCFCWFLICTFFCVGKLQSGIWSTGCTNCSDPINSSVWYHCRWVFNWSKYSVVLFNWVIIKKKDSRERYAKVRNEWKKNIEVIVVKCFYS